MAGGKRKGAGRPRKEQTTVVRVPVGVLDQVKGIIEIYKNNQVSSEGKSVMDSSESALQRNRKNRSKSKSYFPVLTPFELKRLRRWLFEEGFTASKASARKMTSSPVKCQRSFLKYLPLYFQHSDSLSPSMVLVADRYLVEESG